MDSFRRLLEWGTSWASNSSTANNTNSSNDRFIPPQSASANIAEDQQESIEAQANSSTTDAINNTNASNNTFIPQIAHFSPNMNDISQTQQLNNTNDNIENNYIAENSINALYNDDNDNNYRYNGDWNDGETSVISEQEGVVCSQMAHKMQEMAKVETSKTDDSSKHNNDGKDNKSNKWVRNVFV